MTARVVCCLFLCIYVVNVESKGEVDTCFVETSVRFDDGAQINSTCGYVQGRLQICEDQVWKNLCDTNWTFSDAQVTCRSLNYSAIGAENIAIPQATAGSSTNGVQCSGTENNLTECTIIAHSDCDFAISVLCYTSDLNANKKCQGDSPITTTLSTPSTTATTAITTTTSTTVSTHTQPYPTTSDTNPTKTSLQETSTAESSQAIIILSSSIGGVVLLVIGVTLTGVTSVYCWLQHRRHMQEDVHFGGKEIEKSEPEPFYDTIQEKESRITSSSKYPDFDLPTTDNPAYGTTSTKEYDTTNNPAYGTTTTKAGP